ncbi:LysE family translocator [Haloarchaeobius sp. FL176]|uniref:LysE family translocator n=1 Tax=Haloarchaeobius sp. FL176 TaxID=2967129 RepID=UPI0021495241
MFPVDPFVAFVPAAVALVLAPGPDTVFVLARGVSDGRRVGLAAALGVNTGILVHTTAAVLGLSVLLRTAPVAYTVVKYVGAAYLVVLGVRTLVSEAEFAVDPELAGYSAGQAYRRAVLVNVLNPKVALFFLAFLPQFIPASANATVLMSALGVTYAAIGMGYLGLVAAFAGVTGRLLETRPLLQSGLRWLSGLVLVGFGVALGADSV